MVAPPNPELVIRTIPGTSITTFSVPFARGGVVPFGGRSTAVKLADSSVFLIPSHPLCQETLDELKKIEGGGLGVKYLASPDLEHHLFLVDYKQAFPGAKLIGAEALAGTEEKKGIKFDFIYGRDGQEPFAAWTNGEIISENFGKAFANEDIAFLHVPSKTLIEADLLFNMPPKEQYSKSTKRSSIPFVPALSPGSKTLKFMLWHALAKDRAGMSKSAKVVSGWDFDRIIPCHGDTIETGGKKAWNDTYADFLSME